VTRLDPTAPEEIRAALRATGGTTDARLADPLAELAARGRVPLPDRMFEGPIHAAQGRLDIELGGAVLRRLEDGRYALRLRAPEAGIGADLVLEAQGPWWRHGGDGVAPGPAGEQLCYLFLPRLAARGAVTWAGRPRRLTGGRAWFDHEFGRRVEKSAGGETSLSWTWASLVSEAGDALAAVSARGCAAPHDAFDLVRADGGVLHAKDARLTTLETWTSPRSFHVYPVRSRLLVPSLGTDLEIAAEFPDQEVRTLLAGGDFWEGMVRAEGRVRGRPLRASGWLEHRPPTRRRFEDLLDSTGREVRRRAGRLLGLGVDRERLAEVVSSASHPERACGASPDDLDGALLAPVREVLARGGKGWRSWAVAASIEVVGGDPCPFAPLLAAAEVLHVGSLVVDDVEDRSPVRRGAPAAHLVHGDAIATNSGSAAYFLAESALREVEVSDEVRARLYALYFEALRAGHAGQALDLRGVEREARVAAETGATGPLVERILAVHRMKTAVPAGCLARMGAILGGGTRAQEDALGALFEAVGLAFQVQDDVLDIRGFEGGRKPAGGDLREGKVTLPIALAFEGLALPERRRLLGDLLSRPEEPAEVGRLLRDVERAGGLERAGHLAAELVEEAWARHAPRFEDSLAKLSLRAFTRFVLDRSY
jgi:geranylgeranyl pyrophosphate synthase